MGMIDLDAAFTLCVQFSQFTTKLDDGSYVGVPCKYSGWGVDCRLYKMSDLQNNLTAMVNWGSFQEAIIYVYN
jgi:hypothetical protein